jgi:hypothetical protein
MHPLFKKLTETLKHNTVLTRAKGRRKKFFTRVKLIQEPRRYVGAIEAHLHSLLTLLEVEVNSRYTAENSVPITQGKGFVFEPRSQWSCYEEYRHKNRCWSKASLRLVAWSKIMNTKNTAYQTKLTSNRGDCYSYMQWRTKSQVEGQVTKVGWHYTRIRKAISRQRERERNHVGEEWEENLEVGTWNFTKVVVKKRRILHCLIHEEKSNKMQQCTKILLLHIYIKLNMFRTTHRPLSGA